MKTEQILYTWGDVHGDLFRVGRKASRYYIEQTGEAFTPNAGEIMRIYVTKQEAMNFDPDPNGELEYWPAEKTY